MTKPTYNEIMIRGGVKRLLPKVGVIVESLLPIKGDTQFTLYITRNPAEITVAIKPDQDSAYATKVIDGIERAFDRLDNLPNVKQIQVNGVW